VIEAVMSEAARSIRPERSSAWLAIGLSIVCVPIAAYRFSTDGSPRVAQAAVIMLMLCGFLVWRSVQALRGAQSVTWSIRGLEGPGGAFGALVGGAKVSLAWSGLARVDHAGWGVWFVQALDGRRIYWTEAHEGHEDLLARLSARLVGGVPPGRPSNPSLAS
jgi:predicted small integral membrane protein